MNDSLVQRTSTGEHPAGVDQVSRHVAGTIAMPIAISERTLHHDSEGTSLVISQALRAGHLMRVLAKLPSPRAIAWLVVDRY